MDYWTGLCFLYFLNVVFSTPDVFYTVHSDEQTYEKAQRSCESDGFLTKMANQKETSEILKAIVDQRGENLTSFWIGLQKYKTDCVNIGVPLMGFSWIEDNSTDFAEDDTSRWQSKPRGTCTNALCGLLSVTYRGPEIYSWKLDSASCKKTYPFICKNKGQRKPCPEPTIHGTVDISQKHNDPYTLQVTCNQKDTFTLTCSKSTHEWTLVSRAETDITELCLGCRKGFKKHVSGICVDVDECEQSHLCTHHCENTLGSYICKCPNGMNEEFGNCETAQTHPVMSNYDDKPAPPPTSLPQPDSTSESNVHIESHQGDLSIIIIPVIIALLIFVVLVVIVVGIIKCCLIRRSKKRAKERARASKESMALNGSDSLEKMNEKE